ncbi:MAG TPA: imidazole glycerol phosphate synthase subunit HisH [Trebonia sp.]|jgi:glutamine amidotransferase|nr:imidazole glycerol phosphate synthase subunit HisH [Trebonia sp.]
MAADVVVLDYGSGNLRSAQRALARAGADVRVTADLDAACECDGLVVPGVGAYAACMAGLRGVGGDKAIAGRIARRRPVLGICVGMQVLFSAGVEHGIRAEGCEVWPGTVDRLDAPVLPHMGWNTVRAPAGSALFAGLDPGTRFYFVHSYALRLRDAAPLRHLDLAAVRGPGGKGPGGGPGTCPAGDPGSRALVTLATHGEPFVAAVEDGLVSATQFHPEKSGDAGAAVLRNWLGTL